VAGCGGTHDTAVSDDEDDELSTATSPQPPL
jgi:hypothetical protein